MTKDVGKIRDVTIYGRLMSENADMKESHTLQFNNFSSILSSSCKTSSQSSSIVTNTLSCCLFHCKLFTIITTITKPISILYGYTTGISLAIAYLESETYTW